MAAEISRHSGLLGNDPQVATDIGEDGFDRATADLGRDVPGRGQTGDAWFACVGAAVLGLGGARLARGWGVQRGQCGRLADGVAEQPGLERGGTEQAAGDACDDLSDVCDAEVSRDVPEVGRGGALLQRGGHVPAVGDQRADEGEETPGAAGCVGAGWPADPAGDRGGRVGQRRRAGRTWTEQEHTGGDMSRNIFLERVSGSAERAKGEAPRTGPMAGNCALPRMWLFQPISINSCATSFGARAGAGWFWYNSA